MLQLVIGSSAVAGRVARHIHGRHVRRLLLLTKVVSSVRHPLVWWPARGAHRRMRCCTSFLMLLVSRLYTAVDGGGQSSVLLRAMACVLLPPAHDPDGATLPAMARYMQVAARRVSWLGFLRGQHRRCGAGMRHSRAFLLPRLSAYGALVAVAINLIVAALSRFVETCPCCDRVQ